MHHNSQNFDKLRRLIALKRYEQPPPGYFHHFSAEVIARIKAGELGADRASLGSLFWDFSWLERLWGAVETKPIFAASFGLAACAVLLASAVVSERTELSSGQYIASPTTALLEFASQRAPRESLQPAILADFQLTNTLTSFQGSLLPAQQVSFRLDGN